MLKRALFPGGPKVSAIGFGSAGLSGRAGGYGFGPIEEKKAIELLIEAQELGLNILDTAPIYGFGEAEKRIGKAWARGLKRDQWILVSKSGISWHQNRRVNLTNDPRTAKAMLEKSLRDLQTETIDLYMVHWPDPRHDLRGALEVFQQAKEQSKIRWIGLCNTNADDIELAQTVCKVDVIQMEMSLFNHEALALTPLLKKFSMGFMGWGTLDKGLITGTATPGRTYAPSDARSWAPWWKGQDFQWKFRAQNIIQEFARKSGCDPLGLALWFVLGHPELSTALLGFRSPQQLRAAILALEKQIPLKDCRNLAARIQESS